MGRAGERRGDAFLRPKLVRAMGIAAGDRAVVAEARALAVRWLAEPGVLSGETLDAVLGVAAVHGDRDLWERFAAAARATTSMKQRTRLLGLLGRFQDPALVEANLALALDEALPAHETQALVGRTAWSRATAPRGYRFLREHWDAFMARLPADAGAWLPAVGAATCDPGLRADVEAFFRDRSARRPGGPRILAQCLELMDACIAWDRANRAALSAYLQAK